MILLFVADALACGGFFGGVNQPVFSESQQAIFEQDGDTTQVEYLVRVEGSEEDFGWVVPLPGSWVAVEEGDPDRFQDLQLATDPTVESYEAWSPPSIGCTGRDDISSGRWADTGLSDSGVNVVGSGTAGVFDYVALAATDTTDLLTWLEENGWSVGPNGPALDAYVVEGGFQFLALSLNRALEGSDTGGAWAKPMASARITYEGDALRFPAIMSSTSQSETQRTTLYVIGDQRATVAGWQATTVGTVVGELYEDDSSQLYADRLWGLGGGSQGLGLVYANELQNSGGWVTRFDGWVETSAIADDFVFSLDGGTTETAATTIALYENERKREKAEEEASQAGLWALFAPLLALVWNRRRRDLMG